jgi:peptidoglycan/LPS O-acetylase OafA/YrhL
MHFLLTRLRRITSGATWIPEIDGLRFVAIAAVVIYHIGGQTMSKSGVAWTTQAWYLPIMHFFLNGSRGVQLFFVISGFILGRPFARQHLLGEKRVKLGDYYLRRVTRLEPPYILNLLILTLAIALYMHTPWPALLTHLLASVFYLHGLSYREVSWINGVTWSLEIEIQFYIFVPLLVLLYRIRKTSLRRGVFLAAILFFSVFEKWAFAQNFTSPRESILYETVIVSLQFFLSGLLLSDIYLTSLPQWRPNILWDVAGNLLCRRHLGCGLATTLDDRGFSRCFPRHLLPSLLPPGRHRAHRRHVLLHLPLALLCHFNRLPTQQTLHGGA